LQYFLGRGVSSRSADDCDTKAAVYVIWLNLLVAWQLRLVCNHARTPPGQAGLRIHIQGEKQPVEDITLPMPALRLLNDILAEMAKGHGVALLPVRAELTTQQAADLLNVSRPYLIGLLEAGKIPFRLVGQYRRVRLDDLLASHRRDNEARRRIADELTADAQELGMGY
jgi:excisionase family DNA binding protein